ncbi:MAG: CDP-alcohol phosphatidyltransferase family protein [Candidatus Thioglobus sp.]|jgi:phosphatidylglycerophosphate synthase
MVKESLKSLHQKCQLTHANWSDHPWVFLQIRKVSLYITWVFLQTSIKPNTMTLIGISFAFGAAIAFVMNALLLAVLFILLFIVMDFSDGEVSRYRGQTSKEGAYLDKIYIFVGHPVIIAGVAIYQIELEPSLVTIVLGFSCVISVFAFCMVVDYAKKITVWEAYEEIVISSNLAGVLDSQITVKKNNDSDQSNLSAGADILNEKTIFQLIYSKLYTALAVFDFPYLFILLSLVVLLEVFFPVGQFTPIKIFIYSLGALLPLVIILSLWKTLSQKKIDYSFNELVVRLKK